MKAGAFDYRRVTSVREAVEVLAADDEAKLLAGGQSLVPLLNMRLARPTTVVDLGGVPDLDYVRDDGGYLAVGALTRHRTVETSPLARSLAPLLAEAAGHIGHVAIRNRGTVGGSVAHADPAAELPAVTCALDAEIVVYGPAGSRTVAARDFFLGYLMPAIEPDELVTEIRVPTLPAGTGTAVVELAMRSGDFALVAVFAALTLDGDVCRAARIAVAGAASTPVRATAAEAMLAGSRLTPEAVAAGAASVSQDIDPPTDIHASARYRSDMAEVLIRRAIVTAADRAGGAR